MQPKHAICTTVCLGWLPTKASDARVLVGCRSVFSDDDFRPGSAVNGVPGTYFPPRDGCMLRLYNDAHQVRPSRPLALTIDLQCSIPCVSLIILTGLPSHN